MMVWKETFILLEVALSCHDVKFNTLVGFIIKMKGQAGYTIPHTISEESGVNSDDDGVVVNHQT